MSPALTVRSLNLTPDQPTVIVPVTARHLEQVPEQIDQAVRAGADLVEWRVDALTGDTADEVPKAQEIVAMIRSVREVLGETPLLATVRTVAEGGQGPDGEAYELLLETLITSAVADLVDIEYRRESAPRLFEMARREGTPVVASFHNFTATPSAEEIETILAEQERMGASVAKVAVMPGCAADVATLLLATARRAEVSSIPLITMSMAALGAVSRTAGHVFGSAATFGMVGEPSAPGQIPVAQLRTMINDLHQAAGSVTANQEFREGR